MSDEKPLTAEQAQRMFQAVDEADANREAREIDAAQPPPGSLAAERINLQKNIDRAVADIADALHADPETVAEALIEMGRQQPPIDPAVLSASLTLPEKVPPMTILADEQTHARLAELQDKMIVIGARVTAGMAAPIRTHKWSDIKAGMHRRTAELWKGEQMFDPPVKPVGYVDTSHGLFTPDAVIGKFRPAVTEARKPGEPDDWPPLLEADIDDRWVVRYSSEQESGILGPFDTVLEAFDRAYEAMNRLLCKSKITNAHRHIVLTLDPAGAGPGEPWTYTPHLSRETSGDSEKHRGGIVERSGTVWFGLGDPPEYGGPLSFLHSIDPKILEDLKNNPEPGEVKLELPKPLEFSLKDLAESTIEPIKARPLPDFALKDLVENVIKPLPPRQVRANMLTELDAINRDQDEHKALALEHAKEGARRYRTDVHFHAAVHLIAGAINGLIDGWDEVGDRHHLARRVRETVMDILPAVEAIQPHLVAGDRMLFSSELLGEIAKQTLGTLVRVREIRRNDDGTKAVVLEPCTD